MKNLVNIDTVEWQESNHEKFSSFRKRLGAEAGGQLLGTSLYKVPPGKKAFPYHYHHANEEAIFVLDGHGTLRLNEKEIPIKKNDYIALPRGTKHAHQIINTSNEELFYLCISTMTEPDVMEYPDSNKIGIMAGTPPGGDKNENSDIGFYRKDSSVSYFDSEE